MAFDRNGTLRNAEKLLRAGKVDAAIAEYLRVIEDQPTDWATTNTLGDLYVRAGQVDKALEQFLKVAESLREGIAEEMRRDPSVFCMGEDIGTIVDS